MSLKNLKNQIKENGKLNASNIKAIEFGLEDLKDMITQATVEDACNRIGGEMIKEVYFEGTTYAGLPHKFEAGTPNIAGGIAFGAAIKYLNSIGLDAIATHEDELLQYATAGLKDIDDLIIYGDVPDKTAVISFNINGLHPYDVGTLLDQMGIAVRTGQHCAQPVMDFYGIPGTVRASFAFYNTKEEIDLLISGVRRAVSMLL